ncbi:MAG: diguanylate cyclase domain-containing protein [Frankiaceae bacterium]
MSEAACGWHSLDSAAFREIFEHTTDGVLVSVPDGAILAANPAACQMLQRSESEICRLGWQGLADPGDPRWPDADAERTKTGRVRAELRFRRGDGSPFEADVTSVLYRSAGDAERTCMIFRDVTDWVEAADRLLRLQDHDRIASNLHRRVIRRLSSAALEAQSTAARTADAGTAKRLARLADDIDQVIGTIRQVVYTLEDEGEGRYRVLVERSPVPVAVYRASDRQFVYANPRAVELYGARDFDDLLSHHADEMVPAALKANWERSVHEILDGAVIAQSRTKIIRLNGEEITVEVNAARVDFGGQPGVQVELHDVSARAAAELLQLRELELQARTDPLTGTLNRRGWDVALGTDLAAAAATGQALTVAVADLDHFKEYNDENGHLAGDDLLQQLAATWKGRLRTTDSLGRLGGEEFGLCLPGCAADVAATIVGTLTELIPNQQTCSVGIASWDHHESATALMQRADQALYRAKDAGRNRIVIEPPGPTRRSRR